MRTILYSLLVFVLYSQSSWAAGYKSAQQWYEGLSSHSTINLARVNGRLYQLSGSIEDAIFVIEQGNEYKTSRFPVALSPRVPILSGDFAGWINVPGFNYGSTYVSNSLMVRCEFVYAGSTYRFTISPVNSRGTYTAIYYKGDINHTILREDEYEFFSFTTKRAEPADIAELAGKSEDVVDTDGDGVCDDEDEDDDGDGVPDDEDEDDDGDGIPDDEEGKDTDGDGIPDDEDDDDDGDGVPDDEEGDTDGDGIPDDEDDDDDGDGIPDDEDDDLPASVKRKKGGQDYADKFTNYVSMHRHRQHDIILLSQHVDNVSVEIKKQIDTIYEVLNVKNRILGIFPLTVPMADVDVVREAWGFPVQLAHIKRGICEARKVIYDKGYEVFVLTPTYFSLYRSHTKSDEALDRPSLKLGKIGSLFWFARRHGFRFVFWICMIISVLMAFRNMFMTLPAALVESMLSGVQVEDSQQSAAPKLTPVQATDFQPVILEGDMQKAPIVSAAPIVVDDVVSGFVKNGVITAKGILRVGDKMIFESTDEVIKRISFTNSTVYFESGKKYTK